MKTLITLIVVALIGLGAYVFFYTPDTEEYTPSVTEEQSTMEEDTDTMDRVVEVEKETETVIGTSVEGRDITAYHYGEGNTELLFVGGIHGGYSWNTSLVAYELMDYLEKESEVIPETVRVTVIPTLNPDGLATLLGSADRFSANDVPEGNTTAARFNANDVDLNRNFDCDWQETGKWQNTDVSGGSAPFSEPEAEALRAYIGDDAPDAVVVWYSAGGGVFASSCHNGVSEETLALTELYAEASGYTAYESFDFYTITGDMVNWLAKEGIPAVSVLLTTHTDTEWSRNKRGIDALFATYK
ncbi:hypothetical protein KTR10_01630 [Candidatus Kaiserbacteria bacterium]|nr:hypothetical protein [Candidatus Kaiserbacteria bacterium]